MNAIDILVFTVNLLLYAALIVLVVWGFVLFVKLARRGIKALDLYLGKQQLSKADPAALSISADQPPLLRLPAQNKGELSAAIAASIATVMGTDIEGIRIVSCKKIG